MNKMKTFPDAHLCDGENMKDKKVGYVYGYLLAISFLSTGMSALITFPRSICLVDVGISVASLERKTERKTHIGKDQEG